MHMRHHQNCYTWVSGWILLHCAGIGVTADVICWYNCEFIKAIHGCGTENSPSSPLYSAIQTWESADISNPII